MKNLIVALGLVDWESQFVSGLGHPMFGLTVQRRCVDGIDIRAAIQVVECQGVIVTDTTPRIDHDLLIELGDIPLIAITQDQDYWKEFGATHCIALDLNNPVSALKLVAEFFRGEVQAPKPETIAHGLHIAIAGFGGSCGRSFTVKELSWQFSQLGGKSVMVDGDTYGPTLDQELGYDLGFNGLLDMCRTLEKKTVLAHSDFEIIPEVAPRLWLIPGLPRTSRWTDLRIPALRELWLRAKQNYDFVISDIGPILEAEHGLTHETSLPRRHATSLTALESARVTVICARADAVGLARLVRGYLEFHELFSKSDVYVMLWGVTSESHARDVSNAVTRHTGIESVTTVPLDWDASRKALDSTSFIGKQNPKHEITKQFEKLAKIIADQHEVSNQITSITKPRKKLLKRAA
ncbi:unannotated protein [freshwater metagenome]|uniref:Unannotated protein n=1 Tax=freshwater metagenome TaxID=449393 RepID=A0A6J6RAF2_9ZZZZ|nr:hypothetical protein [Actinomycetota bacterium]MSW24911.1 hypothetical protein [Actinomycetota bacterium]MSX29366.1 hypothetical protein [Actinomycetota bacterium]MSX43523.1 hypothetical protein [Actinomycetota bacterium]MSX97196.1 hypothetical protein [Actinomycetota bacterium]